MRTAMISHSLRLKFYCFWQSGDALIDTSIVFNLYINYAILLSYPHSLLLTTILSVVFNVSLEIAMKMTSVLMDKTRVRSTIYCFRPPARGIWRNVKTSKPCFPNLLVYACFQSRTPSPRSSKEESRLICFLLLCCIQ